MKIYYLIVGFAGLAAGFYLDGTQPYPPWWAAFLLGFVPGTLIGSVISAYIKERRP